MRTLFLSVLTFLVAIPSILAEPFEVEEVTLAAIHRIYKTYREEHTVKMGERFYLSDTEFSAEAAEFIPDFAINVEKKEVISRSDEPNNPAVRVIVYKNDEQVDEVWAFPGKGAPHFYRESILAFELVDYKKALESSPESSDSAETPEEQAPPDNEDTGEEKGESEE